MNSQTNGLRTSSSPQESLSDARSNQGSPAHIRGGARNSEGASSVPNKKNPAFALKALDKLIGFSIFMLIFGLPIFFTGLTFQGIIFEKQLYFYFWLLIGLVAWAAKGVITEEMEIRRTPLDIPIIGFWIVYLLATLASVDRWHSFWGTFGDPSRGFMSVTGLIIAYYLILSNFNLSRMKMAVGALVSSNVVLSLWTAIVFLKIPFMKISVESMLPEKIAKIIPLSLVGSTTGLGIYFSVMLVFLSIAILKLAEDNKMKNGKKKTLIGILFFTIVLDLVLLLGTYGFIAWIGLFAGIAVFLIFILSKIVKLKANWTWLPMALFVAVMLIRLIGEVSITRVNLPTEASLNYKMSWDIAVESMKNHFFLGSGPGTFGYDFSLYKPQYYNDNAFYELRFFQGTGAIMEAISTIGIIGTFFLVIMLLSYLSVGFYLISREKEKNKLYSLGFFSASIMILVDVLIMKTEGTIIILAVFLGALSLASLLLESETQPKILSLSLKASPKFALALAFVFMVISAGVAFLFVFLGKVYTADLYAGAASRQVASNQEDAIIKMGDAVRINKSESAYFSKLGEYYMILANKEAMKSSDERDVDSIKRYIKASEDFAVQGKALSNKSISAAETLAVIYENSGVYLGDSLQKAEESYQQALTLDPHNPNFLVKLGQIKIAKASTSKDEAERKQALEEARGLFEKSIEEKKNLAIGYYQLALVLDALKDQDAAINNMVQAVKLDTKNGEYLAGLANMYRFRNKENDIKDAIEILKYIIQTNDKDVNAHFYLGLAYEKDKNKDLAVSEYRKVLALLSGDSEETKKQIEKMIDNANKGIENTPENLGLTKKADAKAADEAPAETDIPADGGSVLPQ